jgi:hypothetical protein
VGEGKEANSSPNISIFKNSFVFGGGGSTGLKKDK